MPVPNTFATATTSIPLSQLDANFATPITIGNTAVQLGNTITTLNNMTLSNTTISVSSNLTVPGNLTVTGDLVPSSSFLRNRIINGDMRIDQRNAGAAVTVNSSSSNTFSVDRWQGAGETTDGVFTLQQVSTAPSGFNYSMKATVTTADSSIGASQRYFVQQRIEGYNVGDLAWGTASAKTITISFWVYSSLTGTFGGAVRNSAGDRSYPFTYTISSANTWEQKSVTIAGDTSGTWLTDNGVGMMVTWGLGVGSSLSGTAGAWAATNYWSATGAVNVISTLNATFYLTGVQLEVGSNATPFERRLYGQELMLCQRYYQTSSATFRAYLTGSINYFMPFGTTFRSAPTMSVGTPNYSLASAASFQQISTYGAEISFTSTATGSSSYVVTTWTASAEL